MLLACSTLKKKTMTSLVGSSLSSILMQPKKKITTSLVGSSLSTTGEHKRI
jgi:hypothetical protein